MGTLRRVKKKFPKPSPGPISKENIEKMDANEPERSHGRLKYNHNLTVVTFESPDLKTKALLLSLLTSYKMKQRLRHSVIVSRLF